MKNESDIHFICLQAIAASVSNNSIEWNRHALERMMERGISRSAVLDVVCTGEIIEQYPSDHPFPSALMLGNQAEIPLHVVVAFDPESETVFIITAYYPDILHFHADFRTRRT